MNEAREEESMDLEGTEFIEEQEDLSGDANQEQYGGDEKVLNASFDASLLQQNRGEYVLCSVQRVRAATSWDERDRTGDAAASCLHPHLNMPELPPTSTRNFRRATDFIAPEGTPVRLRFRPPGTNRKGKLTPASVKRHKAPLLQLHHPTRVRSPLHRVSKLSRDSTASTTTNRTSLSSAKPKLKCSDETPFLLAGAPLLMQEHKRAPKMSWGTHTTAGSSSALETTTETIESSADTSAETSTPFRFATFPASLPRIHNMAQRSAINSNAAATSAPALPCPASVRKRMSFGHHAVDRSHDTSISSLLDDGDDEDHQPGQQQQPQLESSLVDSAKPSILGTPVPRTRLNFSSVSSPCLHEQLDERDEFAMQVDGDNGDLSGGPYETRRAGSFASYVSSAKNNLSGFGDDVVFPHPFNASSGMTPLRGSAALLSNTSGPQTPREVKLHFQFDAAQCSPIPGIPEEDGDLSSKSVGAAFSSRKQPQQPDTSLSSRLSTSRDSSSTEKSGNRRMARPMPDITAFEGEASSSSRDRSLDDSHKSSGSKHLSSPRLLCPPTPVRTPTWAHCGEAGGMPVFTPGGLKRYGRSNSLIATKVLATCSPQVLDGRASLENSLGDQSRESQGDCSKSGDASDEDTIVEDSNTTAVAPTHNNWLQDGRKGPSGGNNTLLKLKPESREFGAVVSMATQFDILSTLGQGAFADAYRVRSKVDGRLYAVKRNRRQFRGTRDREKALAEVKCMQRLQSVCTKSFLGDNSSFSLYILFFYQAWQEDGHFFCQTELCCRGTCRDLFESLRSQWSVARTRYPSLNKLRPIPDDDPSNPPSEGRLFPEDSIWKICHDVSAGLSHIHSHGLVHFDIKPSNLFFLPHAQFGAMCKIGDFGMAGEIGSSEDGQEGDQKYMAPELLSSDRKHPSADIFSLGLTLYELASSLSFVLPSEGTRWHELRRGRRQTSSDIPSCRKSDLVALVYAMLRPSKDERPTAGAILRIPMVESAGNSCDEFLRDYLFDIEEFDRREEQQMGNAFQDDQTPRHAHSGRTVICSPTVNFLPKPPLMYSPEAAQS